jgi:hypothetical protein
MTGPKVGTLGGVGACASANNGVNKMDSMIAAISAFFILASRCYIAYLLLKGVFV